MPLYIDYRFNMNKPGRGGHMFTFADTDETPRPKQGGRGPTYNGVTPTTSIIAGTSTEALAFIRETIGNTWDSWSFWWVMPDDDKPYYKLMPKALPSAVRKIDGHRAQLLCSVTPDGEYDSQADL